MGVARPAATASGRQWHIIDADGKVLGRVASTAARLLQGKHRATWTPYLDNGDHVVIRPLVYVGEDEARLYCKEVGLPIIGCCCPACGDLSLQRQRVKRLILDLEREHSGVKQSMLKALGNVMPRHLLDTRLNPSGELRDSAALRLEEEAHSNLIQIQH